MFENGILYVVHSLLKTKLPLYGFSELDIAIIEYYLRDRYFA